MSDTVRPTTSHNLQLFGLSSHSSRILHPLARFASNFTTLSWVGHVLYVDNNLHSFNFTFFNIT